MAQTLGIIDISWRGRNLTIEAGAKLKPGGVMNKVVKAGRSLHRAEEFGDGEVTCTMVLKRGEKLSDFYTTKEGELIVLCDTGQTYSWGDAFLTDLLEATGGEGGKVEMKWAVAEAEALLNG